MLKYKLILNTKSIKNGYACQDFYTDPESTKISDNSLSTRYNYGTYYPNIYPNITYLSR